MTGRHLSEDVVHPAAVDREAREAPGRVRGDALDVVAVINGVIAAEDSASAQYQAIIDATDGIDPVTEDLCVTLKGDEEEHKRLFKGFLAEMLADQ